MLKKIVALSAIIILCTGCFTIIRPGEVGLKRRLGRIVDKTFYPGLYPYNFFITAILKVPVRLQNLITIEQLPTKEGINVQAEFSILYRLQPDKAKTMVETIGTQYEDVIILSVLRSSGPNVSAKYMAKDLYTNERQNIAKEILENITQIIGNRGVVIEAVLLKSIKLPDGLARSIEEKLQAEQEAQRMEFVLQREQKEAERKVIEAEGIKKSQQIILEGLSPLIIQYQSIEAFKKLSNSPNTKIIITDGSTPYLINQ